MRPHTHDQQHNLTVGVAFRNMVGHLIAEASGSQRYVDERVGAHVNAVAQAAYDLGRYEVEPSMN